MKYIILLIFICGCGAANDGDIGQLRAQITIDKEVFKHIDGFGAYAYKTTDTAGTSISCDDFPTKYEIGDQRLIEVARKEIPWTNTEEQAELTLSVPANQPIVVVVRGAASWKTSSLDFAVGRGCKQIEGFVPGTVPELQIIDVMATTGSPCTQASDCETGLDCILTPSNAFAGGYCAASGCSSGTQCPPGSTCVLDSATGGLCARVCSGSITDCKIIYPQAVQGCQQWLGPGNTCRSVCVFPQWNGGPSPNCS